MRLLLLTVFALAAFAQGTQPYARKGDVNSSVPPAGERITFNKQILPILQKNCQGCHRPGEVGPMSLLDYQSTRPWAKAIKEAVLEKKMPPWFADPKYGHFANDRRLGDADLKTLVSWIDSGCPEGDPKDKPAPVRWRDGWNIRPDVILEMPHPYLVPATGVLQYAYVVIPTGFKNDTWVTAGEIRPSARAVVHHMSAIVRPPGSPWLKDAKPGVPYVPAGASRDGQPDATDPQLGLIDSSDEFLVGYAPGMQPQRFDIDHSAKLIPAGSDIVLQIHYTTNGKTPAQDQAKVGLTLAREPPARRFYSATALSWHWEIPPGDPNYQGTARMTFGEPVELVFIQPHMHLRGKDMTVRLVYPGGESETVLNVPHYSFAWQIIYYLAKPLQLPAGTRVEITAHWDNSPNNPYNPDPAKTVTWGNQSSDEMLSVPMGVIVDRD
jgi:Copper type II ascorbate-dependent monooxygenase, C-terminal domain